MSNPAPADHPLDPLIASRWSPRAFRDRPVEPEELLSLLEAARWAPSSYNGQPWRFILATRDDAAGYAKLLGCLVEFNQNWAKAAPVLLLAVSADHFEHNGKPNAHAKHDVGLALASLALQATSMGLAVHMMAGFDADKAREVYAIPAGYTPITAAAIGYPGDPGTLPDDLREKERAPRSRKALASIVFESTFGRASPRVAPKG